MTKSKKRAGRLLALLLSVVMFVGMLPAGTLTALASDGSALPFTLTYTVNGGEAREAEASEIGTINYQNMPGTVYLVSLPYGAELDENSVSLTTAQQKSYITSAPGWGSWSDVADYSLENMAMLYPSESDGGYKTMMDCATLYDETAISTQDVKGFGVALQTFYPLRTVDFVIVQISTKEEAADENVSEPWDGSIDTSWYNTEDTEFTLTTAEQLAGLAAIVNGTAENIALDSFEGKRITLGADIALNDTSNWTTWDKDTEGLNQWIPIGARGNYDTRPMFAGSFDGGGHVISGLFISATTGYQGLFGELTDYGVIQRVGIVKSYIYSTANYTGAISACVSSGAVVSDCFNGANVTCAYASGNSCVGGIVGYNSDGTVKNCYNYGTVTGHKYAGGISGSTSTAKVKGTIQSCYNIGQVLLTGTGTPQSISGKIASAGSVHENNYYLSTCAADENASSKTSEEMKSEEMITLLGSAYAMDVNNINNGYPILAWQNAVSSPAAPAYVQLEDGTNVSMQRLTGIDSIVMGDTAYPFDQGAGFYRLVVPEGTEIIKLKLGEALPLAEGVTDPLNTYYIGRRGNTSGSSSGGVPVSSTLYISHTVSGKYYASQTALDNRIADIKPAKPRQNLIDSTIVDAVDENGWFTLPLSEFAYDTEAEDQLGVYGSLDNSLQYAEIQLQGYTGNSGAFGAMLLIQIGGESKINFAPTRKLGVPAAETVRLAELDYRLDLSTIFEDPDGVPLTYKYRLATETQWTPIDGSVFRYTLTGKDVTFIFTANDGKTDGATYRVSISGSLLGYIRAAEAIAADSSAYWTEDDFYAGPQQYLSISASDCFKTPSYTNSYYHRMLKYLEDAKNAYEKYGDYYSTAFHPANSARQNLANTINCLLPRDRLNASCLWLAVTNGERALSNLELYTEQTVSGLAEAVDAAKEVYTDTLYLMPYDEGTQSLMDERADAVLTILVNLVNKDSYQSYYETYRSRKDEAAALLELYNPARYTQSDYTADSWQAFADAYNALKADLDYRIEGEGGTRPDYEMVSNFVAHINGLQNAYNNLVSDQDITVSFSYINNFAALYPNLRKDGTDVYENAALELKKGSTTLVSAIQSAGLTFDTNRIWRSVNGTFLTLEDGSDVWLMVYVNGENRGYVKRSDMESGRTIIQLHDGDTVKLVRVPQPITGAEASTGYDTTSISYSLSSSVDLFQGSIAMISIDSLPEGVRVGDSAAFSASVKGSYATNLNQPLPSGNLSLYVSGPSQTKELSQNLTKTTALTDESGNLSYIFTEPGWYTVAMLNAQEETYTITNVFGETTYGTYGSLYAGDFALIYVAPAEDEAALIAAQRARNLEEAAAYYGQFHDYDFREGNYSAFTALYDTLVSNQNGAETFKELMDSFYADYAAMEAYVSSSLLDHDALVAAVREQLSYVPRDLSTLDYTYKGIVNTIQSRYNALNDYQKNLFTGNETAFIAEILKLDADSLYTPEKIAVTVEKDANVSLPETNGNLASAPNENRVYILYPNGSASESYYKFTTNGMLYNGTMEPSCEDMTAYPGNRIRVRRIITQTEDSYWLAYSLDGENWLPMELVDGGAFYPQIMLKAEFILPEVDGTAVTIRYKAISEAEYEEMRLEQESPEVALEEAKAAYKNALEAVFQSYDPAHYEEDDYIDIRDAKNKGLENIDSAKEVSFALRALNAAVDAMAAVPVKSQVHVVVRNDTFTTEEGAPWDGVLVDAWVAIDENSSMMSAIQKALEDAGYTGTGFDSGYISDINGLGEFGGGGGSGWMGTLNDWFTNEGFLQFTVANGKLKAGDFICVEYTCELGADIRGGVQGSTDTSLYSLAITNGTLTPSFDKGTTDYLLILNPGASAVQLTFSASNRSFQARAYRNAYTPSAETWISSGDTIPVQSGDVIYIGIGENAWDSMGSADPTVYTIVVVDDSGAARTLIETLPDPDSLTINDKTSVERANAAYQALTDEQKTELGSELQEKLAACVEKLQSIEKASAVSEQIRLLPETEALLVADKERVENAKTAFGALTESEQGEIPLYLIDKLNANVERIHALVLEKAKADALSELESYKDPAEYSEENRAALLGILEMAKTNIAQAGDTQAVQTALAQAKAAMDAIPTDADLVAAMLAEAKENAKAELDGYKNSSDYRDAQKEELAQAIADGKAAIDSCTDRASVQAALDQAKAAIDQIPTDAWMTAIQTELEKHLAALLQNVPNPIVGSIGGEWAVLALARAGYNVPDEYFDQYYAKVVQALKNGGGILPDSQSKSTEYSRVILALTALGLDVTDVDGHNLLQGLTDMDYVTDQGINGPIFALIAFDSHSYEIPEAPEGSEQVTREKLIAYILGKQLDDGGWALSESTADPDVTAMALQALAPYYGSRNEVKTAVDKALECLSNIQLSNGGFASWGTENSESTAQVIVALTALGIDPAADSRFIKEGGNPITALLSYAVDGGGFKHTLDGEYNQMATEQGTYALAAYDRFLNSKTSLYDMSDVTINANPDVPVPEDKDITLTDVMGTGITVTGKESILNGLELEANLRTSGELYDKVKEALKDGKFTLYDMYLLKNNLEIQPDGTITVSIPVPAGYDGAKCKVYRVNADGSVTEITATLANGKLVFETDQIGAFAVYQPVTVDTGDSDGNGDGTTNPGEGNNDGTTDVPQTGESSHLVLWLTVSLFSLAAMAVLGKRKKTVK